MKTKKPNYRKEPETAPNVRYEHVGHDTIGMVAIDKKGSIACGTSTNGAT